MKYSSETKTYGSIRTMKSGGAAGVILGLAAVGLAMGTSATTVLADESVESTAPTSVVSEVKEGDVVNDTPTGNASTNLNDPAGTISDVRKADLDNADKVSGNVPVSVDHTELKKAAEDAKSVGVIVNQDKTEVATATSTAEDTDKALKSITAKESEKANELNSTATKHSTAVAQWTKEKNSTVASNKDLEQAHKKAVEAYNNFIKTLDSETAEVVAKHKDAIIEVTEQVQKAGNGTTVEGYQEYLKYLAEHEGLNKEAVKEYLVKKADYNSKSTANSLAESRNASNSARIDLENREKSNSVSLENEKRSLSAKAVDTDNVAKSNSVVEENNRRSTSAKEENDKRSNSAKAVEAENTEKSNSVVEENNKRSLSAKAENEKRSNAAKNAEQDNVAKSNSVDAENNKRSLSAKAENEKRSNAVKAVEADNVAKSASVVEENKKRSLSADAETARRSTSADKETARRSDSAKAENERRSLSAKAEGTTNEAQRSQQVDAENARRSNSAKEETAKRSQSADAETAKRSNSAKAENERRSLSAKASGTQNDAQRSQEVDAENARRSNSAKEETAKRSLSAEKVKEENTAKSNSVVAENNKRSLSAKSETDRRSQSAAAENERRSLSAKKAAEGASSSEKENTAIKAYNRAVMEAAGLNYTGNMEQDQKTVNEYNSKLEKEKANLPSRNTIDDIYSTQDTSYFTGEDPRTNDNFVYGWEYVRRLRTSYHGVSTAEGVSPVTLRWKEGLTTISELKGGSIEDFAGAVKSGRVKEDTFLTPPVYATIFTGETKTTPAGLSYKEITYRINNAGEMRNVDGSGGVPVDLLVTARAYIPKGYTGPVYNSIGYSNTNAIDINYHGAGGYELILKPVIKGTNISIKGAYAGLISDVDYEQTSHISTESGVATLNPRGSGLTRDFGHQVFEAPAGGVSDLQDAPSGSYLYTMSGETIRYVHAGSFKSNFKAQNIVVDRPMPTYTDSDGNSNNGYIEFTLFGDWLSIPTTLKSKIILKQPVSPTTGDGSYEKVTYEPATYTPVTYEAKPATFTPATYEKLTYTPGQPVPYTPVTYEKATFTPATYEKLTYTPGQPVPYTPVTYEKATYEKATYEPVVFKPQTPPTYVPVTYEKVTYTPEGTEWKPVSYEKEVFSPKDTSWQPVGYEKVTYSPKDTSWTPVPYTPDKFTPEEVPSIPNNPKLVLSKVAMPVSPEYKRVPDASKAPEVNYHLTSLVVNTPAEKEARNEDGVNINNESVAKGSTNHFILRPKALPAGRPTTTSLVLSDYIADGLELDVKGMTSVNPMYSISYDTVTRKLEVTATEKELANSNADLSKSYSPTAFTVIFRTLNDGATYENVFRMDVNGGNATGSVNVEYRVEGTNVLLGKAKDVVNESVGSHYDTTDHILGTITKDGVTYERVVSHVDGEEQGKVTKETKVVTYYYKPVTETPSVGGVIVHYVDEEGNTLKEDKTVSKGEKVGTPYDTTKNKPNEITVEGKVYKLVPNKTVGIENGKVIEGITEVTYVYRQVTPDKPKGDGYTSYSNKVRIHTPGSPNNPNNPNNPNGNGNHKIQPVKNNTNKEGKNINNASVLQNDTNYYVAEWDLDQYINDKSSKSAIAKGFGYLENYPEKAVTPISKDYYAVTSKGEKVEGLDFYEADSAKLNELPEHVQQFIKDSGIDVSNFGKFQVWVAKDSQAFYDKYVKTGQDIFFHLPMAVNKGFTGEFQNQTFQIDFGNGYFGNVVRNNVPNLTPKKDVVVDGKSANGGTITYGQEFSYLLSGAKLPGNRGSHVWEYRYVDDYDQTGDKYLGKYKVVATTDITVSQLEEVKEDTTFKEDVTLEDGTVVKAGQKVAKGLKVLRTHVIKTGEDVTKFTEASHDEANGIITISFKEEFLKSVVDSSEFGADASIDMKRVAYGEFYNKYTNRVNGVDYISNTVKTTTPKPNPTPEKPNTPNKPEQPQLPNTGTQESAASLVGVTLLSAIGLAGLSRRKR